MYVLRLLHVRRRVTCDLYFLVCFNLVTAKNLVAFMLQAECDSGTLIPEEQCKLQVSDEKGVA